MAIPARTHDPRSDLRRLIAALRRRADPYGAPRELVRAVALLHAALDELDAVGPPEPARELPATD